MKRLLKVADNVIIRENDKMIFSAKKMQILKFNDRGFLIIKLLYDNKKIKERQLFYTLNNIEEFSEEEFTGFINKLLDTEIILEENE